MDIENYLRRNIDILLAHYNIENKDIIRLTGIEERTYYNTKKNGKGRFVKEISDMFCLTELELKSKNFNIDILPSKEAVLSYDRTDDRKERINTLREEIDNKTQNWFKTLENNNNHIELLRDKVESQRKTIIAQNEEIQDLKLQLEKSKKVKQT